MTNDATCDFRLEPGVVSDRGGGTDPQFRLFVNQVKVAVCIDYKQTSLPKLNARNCGWMGSPPFPDLKRVTGCNLLPLIDQRLFPPPSRVLVPKYSRWKDR